MNPPTSLVLLACLAAVFFKPLAAAEIAFRHHFVGQEQLLPTRDRTVGDYGLTALVDLDKDGHPDFVVGGRPFQPSQLYWFEYQGPDRWARHLVGTNYLSDVGLAALDVDRDGWPDLVCSGVWYRNPGRPRTEPFERIVFDPAGAGAHDILVADMDGDGRADVVMMGDGRTKLNSLSWYSIPADPRQPWTRHLIGPPVHGAITPGGVADLDGDGDMDVLRADTWFENKDGKGVEWVAHPNIPMGRVGPYGMCVRTMVKDLDGDGVAEIVMADADITDCKVAILRNADGKGGRWEKTLLPQSFTYGSLHSLGVADFNGDGRPDIVSNEQEELLPAGRENPRWVVWENLGGLKFREQVILDRKLGGHELQVADVDGDGDVDIVSKPWGPKPWNGNGGRMHVDYLENLLKSPPATMANILAASKAEDWRALDPENTLYLELANGRVVIELNPTFAPRHVANVKALAREKYYDGLAIIRVQDNYVVQWGDPNGEQPELARKMTTGHRTLPAEFERGLDPALPFTRLPDGDVYAPEVGLAQGFPVARDPKEGKMWLVHGYGMVGAGRDAAADSGGGAEIYVVIGQAPRHLDRNVTLFGRVIQGMELLSALPRGPAPMGFYDKSEQRVPIRSVRVAVDVPEPERSALEVLRMDTTTFERLIESRRNRLEDWFHHRAGRIELGNVPIPVRPAIAPGK